MSVRPHWIGLTSCIGRAVESTMKGAQTQRVRLERALLHEEDLLSGPNHATGVRTPATTGATAFSAEM